MPEDGGSWRCGAIGPVRTVRGMTTTPVQQSPDTATVERLAAAFNRSFETCEDPDERPQPRRLLRPLPAVLAVPAAGTRRDPGSSCASSTRAPRSRSRILRVVAHRRRLPDGARGDLSAASTPRSPASCGTASCATARSSRRPATATADGTTSCALATPPKRRCCGPERSDDDDHPRHDDRRDGAPGRPPAGAVDLRPSGRDRSGPPTAARPARRAAGRRLLPARAPGDARRSRGSDPRRDARARVAGRGPTRRSPGP